MVPIQVKQRRSVVSSVTERRSVVSSVTVGNRNPLSLGELVNVRITDPEDGEVLVFDSATNSYVLRPVSITSNNISSIRGGGF